MGYPTLEIIKSNLVTGTGLRAFIPSLSKQIPPSYLSLSSLQPVHSLPLLILAELGILGTTLLIMIVKKVKTKNLLLIQTLLVVKFLSECDRRLLLLQ